MSDFDDLYQELILDHNKRPRNRRALETPPAHRALGHNPLCGDQVTIYVRTEGDRITDVAFEGKGCAISTASASLMTEAVKGKTRAEAERLFLRFHDRVTGHPPTAAAAGEGGEDLGKLEAFAGVSEYPVRVKCATLPWHTLRAAFEDAQRPVSTE